MVDDVHLKGFFIKGNDSKDESLASILFLLLVPLCRCFLSCLISFLRSSAAASYSTLSLCGAVPANQRRWRFPLPRSKQLLFVLCGMHGTFSLRIIILNLLHSLCGLRLDTISTMSIRRRKAHFLALVLPYSTNIDSNTHYASICPDHDLCNQSPYIIIITPRQSASTSRLHAQYLHPH